MALTAVFNVRDELKGPAQGFGAPGEAPLHVARVSITLSGTYSTGGTSVDLCSGFVNARMAYSALQFLWLRTFGDYWDGANLYTFSDSSTVLTSGGSVTPFSSGSTSNVAQLKIYSGGANGAGGSELAASTAVNGVMGLVFAYTASMSLNGITTSV